MRFAAVLGQEHAGELMEMALAQDRISHAYIFSGPDGAGKTIFALEFAKALLCRKPGAPHDSECAECRSVETNNHPDFDLVEAQEGKRSITIEQVRRLISVLNRHPMQSQRRVVILREADRLGIEAANALLKTLEEPASFAILILTTALPRNLPDTIRSRCQDLRFAPLSAEHVHTILSARPDIDPAEVALAARIAQGSAGRAIRALESGCISFHLALLERVLALPEEDPFALSAEILAWLKSASAKLEPQRERLREMLRLLVCAYRDTLLIHKGGDVEALFHRDQAAILDVVARRLSGNRITAIVESLWNARAQTDRNAAISLVLEGLFIRIGELQRAA
jgi:DNA polymerase-3 subunit delta'